MPISDISIEGFYDEIGVQVCIIQQGETAVDLLGGFCAFADPDNRFSFGYTPNRYTHGYGLGDEPNRLMEAVYAAAR